MTKEDLQRFCSEDDSRKDTIGLPFSEGEWTYATDGRILLRVPRLADVPENPKAPKNVQKNIFDLNPISEQWQKVPVQLPPLYEGEKCDLCRGEGQHECECGNVHDCDRCQGTGLLPVKGKPIDIGGVHSVSHIYLHKIRDIPGIEICASTNGTPHALGLRFDGGGEGRLMGMRTE